MKYLIFLIVILSFILISCHSVLNVSSLKPIPSLYRNYLIETNYSVAVGEPMIEIRKVDVVPTYEVMCDYQPPSQIFINQIRTMPKLMKGTIFDVLYSIVEDTSYIIGNNEYIQKAQSNTSFYFIHIKENGSVINGWISGEAEILPRYNDTSWAPNIFKKTPNGRILNTKFKAQIIYTGMQGNILKAIYREFIEDNQISTLNYVLQWNLDESKQITFRTIKIEILQATNSGISLKVISDDDLPWILGEEE